jgi:hypothetical protein
MVNYSGFLSTFANTSGTNDIMSTVVTTGATGNGGKWVDPNYVYTTYSYGYMYIGELLVQFTTGVTTSDLPYVADTGSNNAITIYYPLVFGTGGPYCVLANPAPGGGLNNYTVTVTSCYSSSFVVETGNSNTGYIQYLAIGPK